MNNNFQYETIIDPQKHAAMQEAIDIAWQSTDLDAIELQLTLFPNGKPTVTEFIQKMKSAALENELT